MPLICNPREQGIYPPAYLIQLARKCKINKKVKRYPGLHVLRQKYSSWMAQGMNSRCFSEQRAMLSTRFSSGEISDDSSLIDLPQDSKLMVRLRVDRLGRTQKVGVNEVNIEDLGAYLRSIGTAHQGRSENVYAVSTHVMCSNTALPVQQLNTEAPDAKVNFEEKGPAVVSSSLVCPVLKVPKESTLVTGSVASNDFQQVCTNIVEMLKPKLSQSEGDSLVKTQQLFDDVKHLLTKLKGNKGDNKELKETQGEKLDTGNDCGTCTEVDSVDADIFDSTIKTFSDINENCKDTINKNEVSSETAVSKSSSRLDEDERLHREGLKELELARINSRNSFRETSSVSKIFSRTQVDPRISSTTSKGCEVMPNNTSTCPAVRTDGVDSGLIGVSLDGPLALSSTLSKSIHQPHSGISAVKCGTTVSSKVSGAGSSLILHGVSNSTADVDGNKSASTSSKKLVSTFHGKPLASSYENRIIPLSRRLGITDDDLPRDPRVRKRVSSVCDIKLPLFALNSGTNCAMIPDKDRQGSEEARLVHHIVLGSPDLAATPQDVLKTQFCFDETVEDDISPYDEIQESILKQLAISVSNKSSVNTCKSIVCKDKSESAKEPLKNKHSENAACEVEQSGIGKRMNEVYVLSENTSQASDDFSASSHKKSNDELLELLLCKERSIRAFKKIICHAQHMSHLTRASDIKTMHRRADKIKNHAKCFLQRYDDVDDSESADEDVVFVSSSSCVRSSRKRKYSEYEIAEILGVGAYATESGEGSEQES